jgi:hypothetical protein
MRQLLLIALCVGALANGCAGTPAELPQTCAEPGTIQGVGLAIQDGKTGAAYPFYNIVAVATDGAFSDTLNIPSIPTLLEQRVFWLASDRPGNYTVTVQARGYAPWLKRGVVVARVDCKIIPNSLTVELIPAP